METEMKKAATRASYAQYHNEIVKLAEQGHRLKDIHERLGCGSLGGLSVYVRTKEISVSRSKYRWGKGHATIVSELKRGKTRAEICARMGLASSTNAIASITAYINKLGGVDAILKEENVRRKEMHENNTAETVKENKKFDAVFFEVLKNHVGSEKYEELRAHAEALMALI